MKKAPEKLVKDLVEIIHFIHIENKGKKIEIQFTKEANLFLASIASEKKEYILENAKICAIADDYRKPVVTKTHLQWSMQFIESLEEDWFPKK